MGNQKNLSEVAYLRIKELIQNGSYLPGDSLPELELCKTLNMSRTPIREALFRLQEDMIVTIKPRLGAFVSTLDITQLKDLYDLRSVVEGLIAVCDSRKDVDTAPFVKLRSSYDDYFKAGETDLEKLNALNEQFNLVLASGCRNEMALKVFYSIRSKVEILHSVAHLIPYFPIESIDERLVLLDAIIVKDSAAAEESARVRVGNCYQRILDWMSKRQ